MYKSSFLPPLEGVEIQQQTQQTAVIYRD